jgi:hypothetical protein
MMRRNKEEGGEGKCTMVGGRVRSRESGTVCESVIFRDCQKEEGRGRRQDTKEREKRSEHSGERESKRDRGERLLHGGSNFLREKILQIVC